MWTIPSFPEENLSSIAPKHRGEPAVEDPPHLRASRGRLAWIITDSKHHPNAKPCRPSSWIQLIRSWSIQQRAPGIRDESTV